MVKWSCKGKDTPPYNSNLDMKGGLVMLLQFEFKVSTILARKGEDYESIVRLPVKYTYTKEDLEGFAINELYHRSLKDFLQVIYRNDEDLIQGHYMQ